MNANDGSKLAKEPKNSVIENRLLDINDAIERLSNVVSRIYGEPPPNPVTAPQPTHRSMVDLLRGLSGDDLVIFTKRIDDLTNRIKEAMF